MDVDDPLDAYDRLLGSLQAKFQEFEVEDNGERPKPFKRWKRESDLLRAANYVDSGAYMVRCPTCQNLWSHRDVPCERCHGIGAVICVPIEVRDGLI